MSSQKTKRNNINCIVPDKPDTLFRLFCCYVSLLTAENSVNVVQLSGFLRLKREAAEKTRNERGTNILAVSLGSTKKKSFCFVRVLRLFLSRWETIFHTNIITEQNKLYGIFLPPFSPCCAFFQGENFRKIHFNIMRSTFSPFFIFPF